MFSHIIGNEAIKSYLSRAIINGVVGNSFLFTGPKGSRKSAFAKAFAKEIIATGKNRQAQLQKLASGNHPDLHIYLPEGKLGMHSIQAMRELSEEVYLPPFEAERKVFIILDAERMLPFSSNALLKTIEEPSPDTVIILVSNLPELILPTILSRCRKINFSPLSGEEKQVSPKGNHALTTKMLAVLAKGKFENYSDLVAQAKELSEMVETRGKEVEECLRSLYLQSYSEKLTATQRETLEKEIDGAMAMETASEANQLFETILSWHRDLLLLSVEGNPAYLIHRDLFDSLKLSLKNGKMLPLEKVFSGIENAKLALSRSTALNICLETLFLRLMPLT